MRLMELLHSLQVQTIQADCAISGITCDSRQVEPGNLFVCIHGQRFDGHSCAEEVLAKGAAAVVVQRDLGLKEQILVEDTRRAYAVICANFYGNPSKRLKLIGVTGTNGKTTITYLLKHILERAGHKTGLIGTIKNEIDDMTFPAKYTTPDPVQLHALFRRMADAGCEYVVMEVSSMALDQYRVEGCCFDVALFTNLTQDHLDYHGDMENYYQAKKKLFSICKQGVVNYDDPYGKRLLEEISCPAKTFSTESNLADYTARNIKIRANGSNFALVGSGMIARIQFSMPGDFAVSNAMAAAVASLCLGISLDQMVEGLNSCPGVRGRTEIFPTDTDFTVICDYAHAPDSIEKVLTAVRKFAPGKITILLGCAGNRDRTKRKKMAEAAARLADFVILTSDNPRDEDPIQIIEDALPGLKEHSTPYQVIPDRYQAIRWGLEHAQKDEILLLAGKGHEDYQVLDYGTIYFDEKVIVAELLEKIRREREEGER